MTGKSRCLIGLSSLGVHGLSIALFTGLSIVGKFGSLEPFAFHATRMVLYLIVTGSVGGILGAFVDKNKAFAFIAIVAPFPLLTCMGIARGYW